MPSATNAVLEHLRAKGYRITVARRHILGLFGDRCEPLSAQDVHTKLQKKGITANQTTAYRELAFLAEQGILRTVQLHDGVLRYELASAPHHHHVICVDCKTVQEIHADHDLSAMERAIGKKTGFSVLHHALEFFGRCAGCTKRKA